MSINLKHLFHRLFTLLAISTLFFTGCGSSGPGIHPVKGQVQLVGGDSSPLVGHLVEIAKADDQQVRASGEIKTDGKFQLESLRDGKISSGTVAGKYLARIVLSDDDPQARQTAAAAIHPRFLKFNSSGLTVEVPSNGEVELQVSRQ